ncbi:MAG TPA: hypothetical protein DCZ56_05885 [Sutterella sp.]|nr:hypothetical protein [Sutterella sp.]
MALSPEMKNQWKESYRLNVGTNPDDSANFSTNWKISVSGGPADAETVSRPLNNSSLKREGFLGTSTDFSFRSF